MLATMLSDDAFLHNLPPSLRATDRLMLEAIAACIDSVDRNYVQLVFGLADADLPSGRNVTRDERLDWATLAWSIVDNLHMYRSLRTHFHYGVGSKTEKFLANTKVATALRNSRDHVDDTLSNTANAIAPAAPSLGTLACSIPLRSEDGSDRVPHSYCRVVVPLGSASTAQAALDKTTSDDRQIEPPVDDIVLSSFGRSSTARYRRRAARSADRRR